MKKREKEQGAEMNTVHWTDSKYRYTSLFHKIQQFTHIWLKSVLQHTQSLCATLAAASSWMFPFFCRICQMTSLIHQTMPRKDLTFYRRADTIGPIYVHVRSFLGLGKWPKLYISNGKLFSPNILPHSSYIEDKLFPKLSHKYFINNWWDDYLIDKTNLLQKEIRVI